MILSVGCSLGYQVVAPTAHFTFNILANTDAQQRLLTETVGCTPEVASERISSSKGNRVLRIEAPTGPFELRYSATIEVTRPALPASVKSDNPGRMPLTVLTYMLPSRYCESDRFAQVAWELFGKIENRVDQVREVCRWVDANLEYKPGATDSRTSAWDVYQQRKGVCRDYTHLAIALCRALSIPARYVGCYAVGLDPMDFHACFEAYLGGQWHLFDPSDGIASDKIVSIARGRDAANAALTTIFGRVTAGPVRVTCVETPVAGVAAAVVMATPTPNNSAA
jgi:transglutaminase-like putative cysteine protease